MFSRLKKLFAFWQHLLPDCTFRVIDIIGSPEQKNTTIIYQVVGKATVNQDKPLDLFNQFLSLKGFSEKDSKIICELAIAEKLSPTYKIKRVFFEGDHAKFEIIEAGTPYTFIVSAEEVLESDKFCAKLSIQDLRVVYYQYQVDQISKMKSIMKNADIKKSSLKLIHNKDT
jgi:hypothetical protein